MFAYIGNVLCNKDICQLRQDMQFNNFGRFVSFLSRNHDLIAHIFAKNFKNVHTQRSITTITFIHRKYELFRKLKVRYITSWIHRTK